MKPIALIPFVCGAGASTAGSELGPAALKRHGLQDRLRDCGLDVSWRQDPEELFSASPWGVEFHNALPPLGHAARREAVLWHCRQLQQQVRSAVEDGFLPVVLGGDHTLSTGSLSGLALARNARGRTGVLWLDAHPDINIPETSASKAYHGMPVASLLGMGEADFIDLSGAGGGAVLNPAHLSYIGLRDIDEGEASFIRTLSLDSTTMSDIAHKGLEKSFAAAWARIANGTVCRALSIDLDGFDPSETPSVGTPVAGGLRSADAFPLLKGKGLIVDLIDIVEYNPTQGDANKTADFVVDLMKTLFAV